MASDAHDGKPARTDEAVRSPYGPRPLSALVPALVRPAFRGRAAPTAQVLADWAIIVGPAYAALTTPQKLSAGTLTIGCSGPMAMELQHAAPMLMQRVNAHLGREAVTGLRFVQMPPPRAKPPRPAPIPATQAAQDAVAGLPPGELRDSLERLGRAVLAERRK